MSLYDLGNNLIGGPSSSAQSISINNIAAGNYYALVTGNPTGSSGGSYTVAMAALTPVPVPASVWLFGSGLLGLVGVTRRKAA